MDIAIAAAMLIRDEFSKQNICATIQKISPTAAEPGRDDQYVSSFVLIHAKEKLEQEKLKLQQYVVIPRMDRAESPEKEYTHHQKRLQEAVKLPMSDRMDTMIATAMLEQGFKEKEVLQGLSQSPCAKEKPNYTRSIVKSALKNFSKALDQGMEIRKTFS